MNLTKLRIRIAGWFILMALKVSRMFRAVPKDKVSTATNTLRIEANLETPLSPGQLAVLLRNLAVDHAHAPTLLALADGVEGARPAPEGTRGSIILAGDDMVMLPETVARMAGDLHNQTRELTREPGNLVEILLSVVVTSNATTVDRFPVTELTFNTKDEG